VYVCSAPDCGERHRRLVPNRYGAVRHTCRCGARLPTLVVLGRDRLSAECPHCSMPLPGRTGRVRIEHVPIVGGPDAGKSTYLCLAISALGAELSVRGGSASFVDARDERAMSDGLAMLRRGDRLVKTGVVLPRAVMVDLRPADRILYLFDPAGEYYAGREIDSQRYLDHAEVALVVVDPLAIPDVWTAFTEADRQVIADTAPSNMAGAVREKAGDVVDRLVGALRGRPAGNRLTRLLVVVTKSDVLRGTSVGAHLGDGPVDGWLDQVGWGNWVRTLRDHADSVAFTASGLDLPDASFASGLAWVSGVDLSGAPSRRPRAAPRRRRPWASPSRPGLLPPGHRSGRIAVLGLVVLAELVLGVGTIWYVLHTLQRIYT
jgi:hypothetical protein